MVKINPVRKKLSQHFKPTKPSNSKKRGFSNGVKAKIPQKMKWLFWSYNIDSIDLRDDKDYIITQVLNHGNWQDLKWLFRAYSQKEIKEVVKNPGRGVWFEKVLNFWSTLFNIRFKKDIQRKAIFNINPTF